MSTLTIELPETLSQEIQQRGIPAAQLEQAVVHFLEAYLQEVDDMRAASSHQPEWSDGAAFARRVIAHNRALFEELARR